MLTAYKIAKRGLLKTCYGHAHTNTGNIWRILSRQQFGEFKTVKRGARELRLFSEEAIERYNSWQLRARKRNIPRKRYAGGKTD